MIHRFYHISPVLHHSTITINYIWNSIGNYSVGVDNDDTECWKFNCVCMSQFIRYNN